MGGIVTKMEGIDEMRVFICRLGDSHWVWVAGNFKHMDIDKFYFREKERLSVFSGRLIGYDDVVWATKSSFSTSRSIFPPTLSIWASWSSWVLWRIFGPAFGWSLVAIVIGVHTGRGNAFDKKYICLALETHA